MQPHGPNNNNSPLKTLGKSVGEVATSAPVLLSSGNMLRAMETAGPTGVALTTATLLATTGCEVYQKVTGRKLGLPYYVLSGVNFATAASVVEHAGVSEILHFHHDAMKALLPATAFTAWGVGHACAGLMDKKPGQRVSRAKDPQVYYGIGDVAAVDGNIGALTCFGLGLAKAFLRERAEDSDPLKVHSAPIRNFLKTHVTPARFYGLGYVLGALASLKDPSYAGAQACWGAGYMAMEAAKNEELINQIKYKMTELTALAAHPLLRQVFKERAALKVATKEGMYDVRTLFIEAGSLNDALHLKLGMPAGNKFWARAAEGLVELYWKADAQSKGMVLSLLEITAMRCQEGLNALRELGRNGDPLAVGPEGREAAVRDLLNSREGSKKHQRALKIIRSVGDESAERMASRLGLFGGLTAPEEVTKQFENMDMSAVPPSEREHAKSVLMEVAQFFAKKLERTEEENKIHLFAKSALEGV